ncbi:hypothetical protein BDA99DRAFT_524946 [Phascolomyces articulosus]|uniref:C2H2-type domain-containing protein n=1 Tax=Phascolomyces articulosus TaxID=60185 RepID=A0AAD5P8Q3_9FUNG|nr:hypothetical protein BDA99DRAFT_524946 [Phascolomyces articulosus]
MPVPIEYNNSVRRMSTITVPNQDIHFDTYDFQLCTPQKDVKDAFESRELEAQYCRDFSCCGLVLSDLHDLLQHYEECHVRLEEEDDDDVDFWSPPPSATSSVPSSPLLDDASSTTSSSSSYSGQQQESCDALKKKAAAYLSDLYNSASTTLSPLSLTCPIKEEVDPVQNNMTVLEETTESIFKKSSLHNNHSTTTTTTPSLIGKKRSYQQYNNLPSALDLLTQSAAKKLALATGGASDLPTPILTDEDFLAQAGALLASANNNANADKPYKCNVPGCQKAYKNPNGLKYHNQHGHCELVTDESENIASKPYQCTIGDCGKRYKNLNGLKYHIEHSHMAALNHTLASFGSSLFSPAFAAQFASAISSAAAAASSSSSTSTPDVSPQSSPIMSSATLATSNHSLF